MLDATKYYAHLLANGSYAVLLSEGGGGLSARDGLAITRWAPDPTLDADGFGIFIRDLESGAFRRAAGPPDAGYDAAFSGGRARFHSSADELDTTLEIAVAAEADAELRRLSVANRSGRVRRIDVTTYVEIALNSPAGDAAHPAFSRLFVQTAFDAAAGALLARRRLRSPDDQPLVAGHVLVGSGGLEYETDRGRFTGRGRTRAAPAAMTCRAPLSGRTGAVLDPLLALRRTLTLEPGATATLTAILAAADDEAAVLALLQHLANEAATEHAIATARPAAAAGAASLGLPPRWREQVVITAPGPAPQCRADPRRRTGPVEPVAGAPVAAGSADAHEEHALTGRATDLQFFNGYGGFSPDGSEYVIRMPVQDGVVRRPPLPWVNVIANEDAGCIVSESGATYTWAANSRENRLTPWPNDPIEDPHGEALYIRDEESGESWSPTPGPRPAGDAYEARHGFGRTRFLQEYGGLQTETVVFVPVDAPARVARVAITNTGARPRRLTVFSYAQLVLGTHEAETRGRIETTYDPAMRAILAVQRERGEFSDRVAFAVSAGTGAVAWTTDRREFLGANGSMANPAGLCGRAPAGRSGSGMDACAVLARTIELEPGATAACSFVLGEANDMDAARSIAARFRDERAVDASLEDALDAWRDRLGTLRVRTPSPALDIMLNGWLAYQNLSCRMWGRSAFYQSGGAYGFRDQLQDSSALLYMDPAITRRQILLHAAHQFEEGDVLHWWHPPLSKGIRTRFSDDLLWLPYITSFYVARTGDAGILDECVRYLSAQQLRDGEDEVFLVPEASGTSGTLYEHCCRAIDRSLTKGEHGLPLMGVGDWNDGMNRVGREGRGESVWLGFFIYDILRDFIPVCEARGDRERRDRYARYREELRASLNDTGWDGGWYRRAYYDNGEPLGSAASDECRIDALAQAWAVLSGAAPPDRAARALDALERHLVSEADGIIRLLTPAFDRTPNDPGYIKGYLPGVRENGGQYTHGVLWAVRALAEHGRHDRAARLLEMLTPVARSATKQAADVYQVEPYVVAADVYGVEPHVGRGGWTWYTGSAGWMLRVALESVLGIELRRGTHLAIRPCTPVEWPGYEVSLRLDDGTRYTLTVERTGGRSSIAQDGGDAVDVEPHADGSLLLELVRDGAEHAVHVRAGPLVGPRYAPR
jgi:N,N'-diacetylchitobiose phosphorylase